MDWGGSSGMKRTNSDEALSSMTGDVDARAQICPAKFQDQSIVWTNEKHNLYIKSLEATFVQQLHQSIGISYRNLPDQQFANTCDSSDKLTVPRDGCRKMLRTKSKQQMDTINNINREKAYAQWWQLLPFKKQCCSGRGLGPKLHRRAAKLTKVYHDESLLLQSWHNLCIHFSVPLVKEAMARDG